MQITYAGIPLKIVHFHEFAQIPLKSEDNTDYLMTHVRIVATCVVNPLATASRTGLAAPRLPGKVPVPGFQPPFAGSGDSMPVSIVQLRQVLLLPRQQLLVDINGAIILTAIPTINGSLADADAASGPVPFLCDVVEFHGQTTAIVRFGIECWINETPPNPPILLSNRWSSTETVLRDYTSVYSVQGVAVFRADWLRAGGLSADDYRRVLVPPQAGGFQREELQVTLMPDGNTVRYSFRDVQKPYGLKPAMGIVEVEGREFIEQNGTDWSSVPTQNLGIEVSVRGRPACGRTQLAVAVAHIMASSNVAGVAFKAAIVAALQQVGNAAPNAMQQQQVFQSTGLLRRQSLSVSFPKRAASGSCVWVLNGIIMGLGGTIALLGGPPKWTGYFKDWNNDLWTVGNNQPEIQPGQFGNRGDALIRLVEQALGEPGVQPDAVTPPTFSSATQDVNP